jgi:hypothetical protein
LFVRTRVLDLGVVTVDGIDELHVVTAGDAAQAARPEVVGVAR